MNVKEFTYLLQHPEKVVSPIQTKQLEDVLEEYPYFQAARALHLKGLKNLNSFKYGNALKRTAAHTTDRQALFELIHTEHFLGDPKASPEEKTEASETDNGNQTQQPEAPLPETPLKKDSPLIEPSEDDPLPRSVADADHILDPALFKNKPESQPEEAPESSTDKKKDPETTGTAEEIGASFSGKRSFTAWLDLTHPITGDPQEKASSPAKEKKGESQRAVRPAAQKRFRRIDKFIAENPKIVPHPETAKVDIRPAVPFDKSELMTETLAKMYLEQKKYKNAIQAYKILILKYPEKSGFFADRISAIEKIQRENT